MAPPADVAVRGPSRVRLIVAAVIVALVIATVWITIDHRQKPPSQPPKVGEQVR